VGGGGEQYLAPVAGWMLGLWHRRGPGAAGEGCLRATGVPARRAHYAAAASGANEHQRQHSRAWDGDFHEWLLHKATIGGVRGLQAEQEPGRILCEPTE